MKKKIIPLCAALLLVCACNKSDQPGPVSSGVPCAANNKDDQMSSRKPVPALKTIAPVNSAGLATEASLTGPYHSAGRRFGDTPRHVNPANDPPVINPARDSTF